MVHQYQNRGQYKAVRDLMAVGRNKNGTNRTEGNLRLQDFF
jgi:hypothetical protein